MEKYQNKSGNSPIVNFEIGDDFIKVKFKGGKDYIYSYKGKAGKYNVDIMKSLAISGKGLSTYITKNVKYLFD